MTKKPKKPKTKEYVRPPDRVLVLRTCDANRRGYNEFQWPAKGPVEAPDWKKKAECGHGLHGLLWGEGDGGYLDWSKEAIWLVVEVDAASIVELGRKVKFPKGEVVFCGDRKGAVSFLAKHIDREGRVLVGGTATAGDRGTATAGDRGTATAGYRGTATAGDRGTATAGDRGTATAGDRGTATAGDGGTATAGEGGTATAGYAGTATAGDAGTATAGEGGTTTAGYAGTATAGDRGTATAGDAGTATAGDGGTATAGDRGTATAGDAGTATAGNAGTATAGDGGNFAIKWWDGDRYRLVIGCVGENGIKPGVRYQVVNGKLTEVAE